MYQVYTVDTLLYQHCDGLATRAWLVPYVCVADITMRVSRVAVFVLLLVSLSTMVFYLRTMPVGLTVHAPQPATTPWTSPFHRAVPTKSSPRAERPSLSQLLNDSDATRTTDALVKYTNGSHFQRTLWTEMGCQSPHPLLACTVSPKNKSPDFKVATKDVFYENRLLHARSNSCSLVGSAGWLLNRSYGEDIDSHGLVIRINASPIRGFEHYVGRRPADIAIVQKAVKVCPPDISNDTLIVRLYRHVNNKYQTKECMDKYSLPIYAVGETVFPLSQGVLKDYHRHVKTGYNKRVFSGNSFPTSGLMSAIFCLQICKELHLYGFGWEPGEVYSYYRTNTIFKTPHNFYVESTFLKHLSTREYRTVLKRDVLYRAHGRPIGMAKSTF